MSTQVIAMHCRRLGTAAQTLLGGFVEAHGRQLTIAVRRSVDSTNWIQVSFPQNWHASLALGSCGPTTSSLQKLCSLRKHVPSASTNVSGPDDTVHHWPVLP